MNGIESDASPTRHPPKAAVVDAVARVVAAYAGRTDTSPDDIVSLALRLSDVFSSLEDLSATAPVSAPEESAPARVAAATPTPAVPIDKAVTDDKVFCLCCGRGFTMLKRHLKAEHGLTEEEYRTLFGLPEDMPLVAPNYSERKAAYAKRVGLGKYQRDHADPSDSDAD